MLARQEGRRLRIHAASVAAGWLMKQQRKEWNDSQGNNRRTRQPTGECASIATQPGTAARVPTKQDRDSR